MFHPSIYGPYWRVVQLLRLRAVPSLLVGWPVSKRTLDRPENMVITLNSAYVAAYVAAPILCWGGMWELVQRTNPNHIPLKENYPLAFVGHKNKMYTFIILTHWILATGWIYEMQTLVKFCGRVVMICTYSFLCQKFNWFNDFWHSQPSLCW